MASNEPKLAFEDDYFVVTLPGPGDNLDRIRVPASIKDSRISQLSDRQVRIAEEAIMSGFVTTHWCTVALVVTRDTAVRDLASMCELGILEKTGTGRGTKYVPGRATK